MKVMKMFSTKNNLSILESFNRYFTNKMKYISLNQFIPISLYDQVKFDSTSGIYTNSLFYFKIVEIHYEEYDYLRLFYNENIVKNCVLDNKIKCELNTFLTNKNIEIEFMENSLESNDTLPLNILKFHCNSYFNQNNPIRNNEDILIIPQFRESYNKVKSLLSSNSCKLINTNFFFSGPNNCGKKYILKKLCDKFGYNYFSKDLNDFTRIEKLISFLKRMEFFSPCIVNLKNFQRINDLIKNNESFWNELLNIVNFSYKNKMVLVFNLSNIRDIDQNIRSIIDFQFDISIPNLKSRVQILQLIFSNIFHNFLHIFNSNFANKIGKIIFKINSIFDKKVSLNDLFNPKQIDFEELGKLTVGKDISELKNICILAFENYTSYLKIELKRKNSQINNISDFFFDKKYVSNALHKIKSNKIFEEKNTTSAIPEVKWEDVGGLESAKGDIYDTIQLPLKFPKLFENGLKRRTGLLLFGPPGSGKTLLAKAIANECSMNFLSIKGPELLNMYVGESEKNIRDIFEKGRENRPCVLFFDEIDALAPARSKNTDSNNVMDRIVAQFMSEMDGLTKENDLIIIASTNRPDLLDVSLLRPGRFDKMIYIGLPKSKEEKLNIYKAQTKNLKLDEDINLENLAEISKENYSGADIFAVCSLAFTYAMKDFLSINIDINLNPQIKVKNKHFLMALNKVNASLSLSEIIKYENLRKKYSVNHV